MKTPFAIATFAIAALISFPAFAADDKPLDLGEIAWLGGAYTSDGRHFVFAQFPADGASEIKACDTRTGAVQLLGKVKLIRPQPAKSEYRYSMGVLAAENDLSIVYVGQHGKDLEIKPAGALAWDVKSSTTAPAKNNDRLKAQLKARSAPAPTPKAKLEDASAEAAKLRESSQPLAKVPDLVGQKMLTIDRGGDGPIKVDVTEAYRELYAAVVTDYPKAKFEGDTGDVRCRDSLNVVTASGKWVVADCGVYAHYGIHGRGYNRLIAVNTQTKVVHRYPGIGAYSASGLRVEPTSNGYVPSPDGKTIAGMAENRLTCSVSTLPSSVRVR